MRRSRTPKPDEIVASLEAELLLLREENARLKAGLHPERDLDELLTQARSVSVPESDDAAQVLAETLMIREILLELCREVARSVSALVEQLEALKPPAAESQPTP